MGVLFLLQASASFAVAALLLIGGPIYIRMARPEQPPARSVDSPRRGRSACSASPSSGWQPSPQSLLSVLVEVAALVLLAPTFIGMVRTWVNGLGPEEPGASDRAEEVVPYRL